MVSRYIINCLSKQGNKIMKDLFNDDTNGDTRLGILTDAKGNQVATQISHYISDADRSVFEGLAGVDISIMFNSPSEKIQNFRHFLSDSLKADFAISEAVLSSTNYHLEEPRIDFDIFTTDKPKIMSYIEEKLSGFGLPPYSLIDNNMVMNRYTLDEVEASDMSAEQKKEMLLEGELHGKLSNFIKEVRTDDSLFTRKLFTKDGKQAIKYFYAGKAITTLKLLVNFDIPNDIDLRPYRFQVAKAVAEFTDGYIIDNGQYSNNAAFELQVETLDPENVKRVIKNKLRVLELDNYTLTKRIYFVGETK